MRYQKGFRILDFDPATESFKTLFHAVNGSRVIPVDQWLKAERKLVSDGKSTKYVSGFHVFKDPQTCHKYSLKFKHRRNRRMVLIHFTGNRIKSHSPSRVILADQMKVPASSEGWSASLTDMDYFYTHRSK